MDVIPTIDTNVKAKILLVFFCCLFSLCQQSTPQKSFELIYKDGKAVQIEFENKTKVQDYHIKLKGYSNNVLGYFKEKEGSRIEFAPVIPFTPEETYLLFHKDVLVKIKL